MANPQIEVEVGAKISDLQKKLNQVDRELDNTGKSFGKLNSFAVGALQGIAAAFSIGAVIQFGRAVLDTTAKFQKFEAVLTNTLGSGSDAQIALIQIQDFASKTPFAVDELTAAFVKLANQGFKPTTNELRSLGDLASSTGKSFDQLAEAVIDAQVGEFERLKEFGIRAQKSGDQVTFTFKGVETQVKATDEAIRGYILSLGDAEGVSGAMAGISETLGGKISNLGDNVEQLKLAIGDQTTGIYAASINWLNDFVALATAAAKGVANIRAEASFSKIGQVIKSNRDEVFALAEAYQKINPQTTEQQAFAKAIADVSRFYREAADSSEAFVNQSYTQSELSQIIEGFNSLSKEVFSVKTNTDLQTESVKKLKRTYEELIPVLDQALQRASIERLDQFSQGAEAPITVTSGKAETQGINTNNISSQVTALKSLELQLQGTGISVSQFYEAIANGAADGFDSLDKFITRLSSTQELIEDSLAVLESGLENTIGDIAFSIGDALANGGNVLEAGGAALLGGLASTLNQLGQLAIQTGVAIGGIKAALKTLNPAVAIAAGVALVGLAGFVSAKAKSLGGFKGGGASGVGTSGVGTGSSFSGSGGATGFSAERNINLVGSFRIAGNDLLYVIDRSKENQI